MIAFYIFVLFIFHRQEEINQQKKLVIITGPTFQHLPDTIIGSVSSGEFLEFRTSISYFHKENVTLIQI
jgi:hypothetical protein